MPTIFITSIKENADLAEELRQDLEARGYTCWREPAYPGPGDSAYPYVVENAILGSAALVLLWSATAAQEPWLDRWLHFARSLKKLIIPVTLDATPLPATLRADKSVNGQASSKEIVANLLPLLPTPDSKDALIELGEQAASDLIRVRKEAIDTAAEMLKRNEHREMVLSILEYLAQHDAMTGVRDKAREVLEADKKRTTQIPAPPNDARHIIGVQCGKCGHISYFDKRRICAPSGWVMRGANDRHRMDLPCKHCSHLIPTDVDCEGYR